MWFLTHLVIPASFSGVAGDIVSNEYFGIGLSPSGSKGSLRSDRIKSVSYTHLTLPTKKLLFLNALFTSMLIGFASCSDSEDIIDCTDEPQWFPTYTLVGKLTY